ncbi:MAG: V-type ATP synthase subunit D [Methylobacter sp.]|nr:MAG: V-type ATP synthase subunit D [Methylobacter sp.]PPD03130.1 MAG: V-type ATP synthase subunit D [Methylobacter sp.]PPD21517.1 MAG: V-type ATP synthase subunit D [Methylobacter sp.]
MTRQSFSKAALHKEVAQLKRYQQFLPSLDLKRQQLIGQRYKVAARVAELEQEIARQRQFVAENLPMMADQRITLEGLVSVSAIEIGHENNAGVNLPVLKRLDIASKPYSPYAKPHWVDQAVAYVKRMLELKIRLSVEQRRLEILQAAVKKVTQRVNFFDKIMIPRARQTIKKISIFLSDSERAGVVRAKITKQKRWKAPTV